MLLSKIASSILEIILFSLIPFIWWIITARKKERFWKWLGFKKIENKKTTIKSIILVSIIFSVVSIFTLYMVKDVEMATSEFRGLGISGILPAMVYAIFNTSLPEEIFFRGFLLKRLANKMNFVLSNCIQSLLFGLIHGILFINYVGMIKAIIIILVTGSIAYFMGYINEKQADGSIYPSWCIHAIANIFSSFISLFSII